MHGTIFAELKKYVTTKFSEPVWDRLLEESGIGPRIFLAFQTYPDHEAVGLVTTASRLTGTPASDLLEDFGKFIAPDLIGMYKHLVKPEWKTLGLLEHTEETIHHVVRLNQKGAEPPALSCTRLGNDEVVITYSSPRQMCALAVGIIKGLAAHYNEHVVVNQTRCMLEGSPACEISVKRS